MDDYTQRIVLGSKPLRLAEVLAVFNTFEVLSVSAECGRVSWLSGS